MCLKYICCCSQKIDWNNVEKKMAYILLVSIKVLQAIATQMQIEDNRGKGLRAWSTVAGYNIRENAG